MKPSICFIANFSKTFLFHAIAEILMVSGIKVNWICNNVKLKHFLEAHYPKAQILYLNRDLLNTKGAAIKDFKLNEIIYGDRVWKYEQEVGKQFLTNIQQPIFRFIQEQEIKWMFGEITWAHEVLIHRMCRQLVVLNCTFLNPHVTRIPSNRFTFFEDEQQSVIHEIVANPTLTEPVFKIQEPAYMKFNRALKKKSNSYSGRLNKIKRFITNENIDPKDPTLIVNERIRFITRFKEEYRKESYKFIKKESIESIGKNPYIYLGLHKQPEASVDIFGRYYENQLQNIINLWRVLPAGWKLVIKEHPMAIGDRPFSFYASLKKLAGIVLLEEQTNSHQLIKQASLVVTITGTIALEAALMGIPSATFAPTFFNRLHLCQLIDLATLLSMNHLQEWINDIKSAKDNRLYFSNYLIENSFSGKLLDPITDKSVLDLANIKQLAEGFNQVLRQKIKIIQGGNQQEVAAPLIVAA